MESDEDYRKRIIEKLNEKISLNECPLCHNTIFTLSEGFYFISNFTGTPLSPKITTEGMPTAAVVCNNCGYTFFFNLLVLGLIDDAGKSEVQNAESAAQ